MRNLFGYKEYNFDFLKKKKWFYLIALLVILPGMIMWIFAGMNLGIDFTGGAITEIAYESTTPSLEDVRSIVIESVSQTPSVNESGDATFLIRTEELSESESASLISALESLGELTVKRTQMIGPLIGQELLQNAKWALLIAAVLMLAYITIRFRLNYAIAAILALVHDALVVCSIFVLFRIEINSYFIAAILTTVGYSINNTIVIFDRIRENEAYFSRKERHLLVNASINQTLTRTINTVLAVLILLFALLIFGGVTTKTFMIALTVGMFAGFYSSVFLVGNIFCDLTVRLSTRWGGDRKVKDSAKRKITLKR